MTRSRKHLIAVVGFALPAIAFAASPALAANSSSVHNKSHSHHTSSVSHKTKTHHTSSVHQASHHTTHSTTHKPTAS